MFASWCKSVDFEDERAAVEGTWYTEDSHGLVLTFKSRELTDYSQVDMLGVWSKSVKFRAKKSPGFPNWCA